MIDLPLPAEGEVYYVPIWYGVLGSVTSLDHWSQPCVDTFTPLRVVRVRLSAQSVRGAASIRCCAAFAPCGTSNDAKRSQCESQDLDKWRAMMGMRAM